MIAEDALRYSRPRGNSQNLTMAVTAFRYWIGLGLALGALGCSAMVRHSPSSEPPLVPALKAPTASVADLATSLPPSVPATVWDYLRQGDQRLYVVLLRHALAPGTGDPANFRLGDCATQRNLSEAGRQQAIAIGQAFRQQGVTVEGVLSSQWCRCLETAELLGLGPVEPFAPLNSFFRDRRTTDSQTAAVEAYLRQQPQGVLIMVTHQVNITALTGIFPPSGHGVVVAVEENQPFTTIGTLETLAP